MRNLYRLCPPLVALLFNVSQQAQANECCPPYNESGFFVKAEGLYWRAAQEGLSFFIQTNVSELSSFDNLFFNDNKGKTHKFHFDWNGGYRVGLGYSFCGGWTLAADWTQFQGSGRGSGKQPGAKASARWKLDYDILDILLRSPYYCPSACFSWNLFGGVRGAWIDQTIDSKNQNETLSTSNFSGVLSSSITTGSTKGKTTTELSGFGPELGINLDLNLGCGFSLYGNLGGALLFAHYKTKESFPTNSSTIATSSTGQITTNTSSITSDFKKSDNGCQTVIDLGLGISWQYQACCYNRNWTFILGLGLEHHQWFDQIPLTASGDLCLDGATLSASVMF